MRTREHANGSTCKNCLDSGQDVLVALVCGYAWIVCNDCICTAEEKTSFTGTNHVEVVVAVTRRDRVKADRLKRAYGRELALLGSHPKAVDHAVRIDEQRIAKECGPAELLHERTCELLKRIADNDDLGQGA